MPNRGGRRCCRAHVLALTLALHISPCDGVTFKLEPSHERCISETIPVRSLLTGDWTSLGAEDQSNTQVRAPSGKVLFENKHAAGHFSVTAAAAGEHHVCVRNEGTTAHEVSLNVKQARHTFNTTAHAAQWRRSMHSPPHRPLHRLPGRHHPLSPPSVTTLCHHRTTLCQWHHPTAQPFASPFASHRPLLRTPSAFAPRSTPSSTPPSGLCTVGCGGGRPQPGGETGTYRGDRGGARSHEEDRDACVRRDGITHAPHIFELYSLHLLF